MPLGFSWSHCGTNNVTCSDSFDDFEPDPDIAGVGVIWAFAAVSGLACFLSLGCAVYRFTIAIRELKFDPNWIDSEYTRLDNVEREKAEQKWKLKTLETTIISCCDQQIFTGLAYGICIHLQSCTISAYHYNIVTNLMLMTCATHMVSLGVCPRYYENLRGKLCPMILRFVLMVTVYFLTAFLVMGTFPDPDLSGHMLDTADLTERVVCLASNPSPISTSHARRYLLYWLTVGLGALGNLVAFLLKRTSNTVAKIAMEGPDGFEAPVWTKAGIYSGHLVQIGITLYGLIAVSIEFGFIMKLRHYISGKLLASSVDNPENEATTFAQFIPLVLITLTLFALADTWFDFRRERGERLKELEKELEKIPVKDRGKKPRRPEKQTCIPSAQEREAMRAIREAHENQDNPNSRLLAPQNMQPIASTRAMSQDDSNHGEQYLMVPIPPNASGSRARVETNLGAPRFNRSQFS